MDELAPMILITVLLVIVATGIIMMVLVYQKKQLQYMSEKKQLKATYEREILESKLEIQEQTMKNIAQEVHDNIGQMLSLVKLNMNSMNGDEPTPVLRDKLKDTSDLVGKVIEDMRDLSKSLHTDAITEKGLIEAIAYEFELVKKAGNYVTVLDVKGEPYDLPDRKELILFRIFQEGINNTIKHANASCIHVLLCFYTEKLLLQITDDGQGFDAAILYKQGIGLKNMKNRSQLMGASYTIASQPGKGTSISIELPVVQLQHQL